jgi:ABC-type antimicrobial peptide transport system permease subunit
MQAAADRKTNDRGHIVGRGVRHRLMTGFLAGIGAFTGLAVGLLVMLNLNIFGVDDGYRASPAQVVEHSVLLAVIDVLLLLAASFLAFIVVVRLRAPCSGQP